MQAINIVDDKLVLVDVPVPQPVAGQVLIKVAAAGVNRPDLMQRQGTYPPPAGASKILGLELAGKVVGVGPQVTRLKEGDEVCALVTGGAYAEYCLASESCCLPIPQSFSYRQAAALPETFFTAWSNVFQRGALQAGETVLVHGGGSGIGTTAVQLIKAFGGTVYVTVGSAEKGQRCLALGADAAIDYRQQDFVESILQLTAGKGVDVILDMIGGDYLARNLRALAVEGRLLQIAIQNGAKAELNLWQMMLKRLTLTGSTLRGRDDTFKGAIATQLQAKVWPLLESGRVMPVIDRSFPLALAEEAHALLASSRHFGKLVLEI